MNSWEGSFPFLGMIWASSCSLEEYFSSSGTSSHLWGHTWRCPKRGQGRLDLLRVCPNPVSLHPIKSCWSPWGWFYSLKNPFQHCLKVISTQLSQRSFPIFIPQSPKLVDLGSECPWLCLAGFATPGLSQHLSALPLLAAKNPIFLFPRGSGSSSALVISAPGWINALPATLSCHKDLYLPPLQPSQSRGN